MKATASNNDYEGHTPETCNFQRCTGNQATPCPFLRDLPPLDPIPTPIVSREIRVSTGCKHEWRQLFLDHGQTNGFFCIHCLAWNDG